MLGVSLLLFAALAGDPAPPAKPAAEPTPAVAAKSAKPKKICVEEAQIGSLMKHRICATQAEWDHRAERDAAEMDRSLSVPSSGPQ